MEPTDYLAECAGVIGRYRAASLLGRGERVVVQTDGVTRLAEVLRPATQRHTKHYPECAGEVLRPASSADLEAARRMADRATELMTRGGELAAEMGLPVALLDAELTLDGVGAAAVYVCWGKCDIRDLVRPLVNEFGVTLSLTDLTVPSSSGGCGDCGSGGGCGDGGCGSGGGCGSSVSREELQEYFAGLREQYQRRVPLL